jgi:protein-disulfide isomerase
MPPLSAVHGGPVLDNRNMRVIASLLIAAVLGLAQDWRTATELPGVSWDGATPAQKLAALNALRAFDCTCGCNMKLAQCRIEDPPCGHSRALATMAVAAAKQGKSAAEIREVLEASSLVKTAKQQNRILLDPVAIPIAGAPFKGPTRAKVTIVEFSDFQCPYCAVAVGKLNAALQAYPHDVRLVFKQFPLDFHSNAAVAAAASLAAQKQGQFWPLHDKMYAEFRHLSRANILEWAKGLGLDAGRFQVDMDSAATKAIIQRDMRDGMRAGVQGTPTVFVNGKKYQGSLNLDVFRTVIDAELKGQ